MRILLGALTLALCGFAAGELRADGQVIGGVDTSRWHGFNLLEKFTLRGNAPYREDDFRWIAELGFNFVRLPMDYRCYTEAGDGLKFREPALAEIDQAIAFGEKYHVHVCLNLHRAPGYCINPPAEPKDLWTDPAAEEAFVAHWAMFARRYRDVPPERLSFNLLNEPSRNTRESYLRVHRHAVAAIHALDPRRLVIVDGNNAGRDPAPELLAEPNVIQATRGYHPASLSHFRAGWVRGSDTWPVPTWPLTRLTGHLYGPAKPELKTPLVLHGNFAAGTEFTLRIRLLSGRATLQARAGGQIVARADFDPKENPTAWRDAPQPPWVFHEPAGEMSFVVRLPAPAKEVEIENTNGDWIQFQPMTCRLPGGAARVWPADATWGTRQSAHDVGADGELIPPRDIAPGQPLIDYLRPWRDLSAQGATVFVGEWGCFNKTPHPVALAWMQSWLEQWRQARFGWALWNFRGSFGILDSNRADVAYEDWHGHQLDREMLRLLQRFSVPANEPTRQPGR